MSVAASRSDALTAIRTDLGAIFVSLGTQSLEMADHLAVARGGKMSKHSVTAGDIASMLAQLPSSPGRQRRGPGNAFQSS